MPGEVERVAGHRRARRQSGGDAVDRAGKVYGTSETALDDVIGQYALAHGFAYASVDRDGIGGTRAALQLTMQFADLAKARSRPALGAPARRQPRGSTSWGCRRAAASRACRGRGCRRSV